MGAQVRQLQQQLDESRTQSKQEVTNVRRRLEQEKKRINQAHEITVSQKCDSVMSIMMCVLRENNSLHG